MQAALGLAQLEKLESFIAIRRKNFERLTSGLSKFSDKIILPKATPGTEPSWFGYLISLRLDSGINRNDLIMKLTDAKIATRLLFAGDIRKQPYFKDIKYRDSGSFSNTDLVLHNTFWIGVTPMIDDQMVDYIIEVMSRELN